MYLWLPWGCWTDLRTFSVCLVSLFIWCCRIPRCVWTGTGSTERTFRHWCHPKVRRIHYIRTLVTLFPGINEMQKIPLSLGRWEVSQGYPWTWKQTFLSISLSGLACFEDWLYFKIISVLSGLGSKRYPVSEIVMASLQLNSGPLALQAQELYHNTNRSLFLWMLQNILCLSDKFSCTGRFPCTPKITCLWCSKNKLFGRIAKQFRLMDWWCPSVCLSVCQNFG